MENRTEDHISRVVIGAASAVHSRLGPGLLESAYEACLAHELNARRLCVARQVQIPVIYDGMTVECGYRADLVVEDAVIVELKAVERLQPIHAAQALTYLRLTGKRPCLLLNFNTKHLRDGIQRVVNRP